MKNAGKYAFRWDLLGNLATGRPNLGPNLRVEVYRLMEFTLRAALEGELGTDGADRLFREAGRLAGQEFYRHMIGPVSDLEDFMTRLQTLLPDLGIGIPRLEESDLDGGHLVLTVSEDLDCSGLPETGEQICVYDEGFLQGLLESFTGRQFRVREVDCWCTGDRTCRFRAEAFQEGEQ